MESELLRGVPVINNWEMQGARGSLALKFEMKELAQFRLFFFSLSPFLSFKTILNLLYRELDPRLTH